MTQYKLILQLFAAGETAEAGNGVGAVGTYIQTTASSGISAELKDFYSKDLIEMVGPNLIHAQFGDKVVIPRGHKRNIEFRKFSKFSKALTPLTEGVTPAPHMLTVSTVTKELDQYGDYSILSDILELEAVDPIVTEYTARHAENASLTLDTLVRNDLNTGTFVRYASTISGGSESAVSARSGLDATAILKVSDIAKAATDLKRMNAPKFNGSYVAIIHPSVAHDIMASDDWIDVNKYSNATAIFNGEIGKLYGVRFIESTEAKIWGTESTATTFTYVSGTKNSVTVTPSADVAAGALVGKSILVTTGTVKQSLTVKSNTAGTAAAGATEATALTIVFENNLAVDTASGTTVAIDGNSSVKIYSCLFIGKGAYKVTELDKNNMEVIVKGKGSAGSADPLNQRSTIGWKTDGYGAVITIPEYILRLECTSTYQSVDSAN